MIEAIAALSILVALNIIFVVFGAGKMYQKISSIGEAIEKVCRDIDLDRTHIHDLRNRVSHMEGRMSAQDQQE